MKAPDASALTMAKASRTLFNEGDTTGAERILAPLMGQLGSDPSALHLMGLIKRAQNQLDEAERYLRSAISHSFDEGGYYNDLGVVLQAKGQLEEALKVYRAALALVPQAAATRVNLVRCLMLAGDLANAEQEARTYISVTPGPEAWTLLGQVQNAQQRYEDAVASAEAALKYNPNLRALRFNHATALDRAGKVKEALGIYDTLGRKAIDSQDLPLNWARALYAEARKKDAETVLEKGVAQFPGSTTLHGALARVRWLRGEQENATALIEADIAKRPNDLALRLACADALHRGQHPQKALQVLNEALAIAPDTPALLNAMGIVLDELDRPHDALQVLRRVTALQPNSPSAERNLLSTLIRAGQPEEALAIARELRATDPHDQYLIACEALALRVLGDRAYHVLYDYDRLVRTYEIAPPRGFFTKENFNAALADFLRQQHKQNAHPLDQHLHNGSQTARSLLTLNEPNIKAFMGAIDDAVRDYITHLDKAHPMGARGNEWSRYSSLWSVRLTNEGYQPNHVHDRGWISSAYFVSTLAEENPRTVHAGWLKLGEPNRPIANCPPERVFEPTPGQLVLFPSYMWHGTIPFEGTERLSLAFDVVPS